MLAPDSCYYKGGMMEFGSREHLRKLREMKGNQEKLAAEDVAAAEQRARELGVEAAKAAASWATDGNMDVDERRRVLNMLRDGDPEAWDYLPVAPNLSGQDADDNTPKTLWEWVTGLEWEDADPDLVDALSTAWENAVDETFESACEAELMRFVGEEETP